MTCLLSIQLIMTWCTEAMPNVCGIHYTHVLNVMRYEFGGRADESCPGANLELQYLFPCMMKGERGSGQQHGCVAGCLEFSGLILG